jgi:poly-gamma-glutamate synthesis protein (capsule biosynthesis protein)
MLFFGGDVMLGRGIDQIFKYKNDPTLHESFMKNAKNYVPKSLKEYTINDNYKNYNYIWGDLLQNNFFKKSIIKIINLETSITNQTNYTKNKAVLYKMHPKNIETLKIAKINYCAIANNHVLDWTEKGLLDTIDTLEHNKISYGGIGKNIQLAKKSTSFNNIKIFTVGDISSGIPYNWKATTNKPGIHLINIHNNNDIIEYINYINNNTNNNDYIIVSIHWSSNWNWNISSHEKAFAHKLIDLANVSVIHGHSSHHFKPIESYKNKLIFYGCGDLINDYEIIKNGRKNIYLTDINLTYFIDNNYLYIVPFTLHNMQLKYCNQNQINKTIDKLNELSNIKFTIENNYIKTNFHNTL